MLVVLILLNTGVVTDPLIHTCLGIFNYNSHSITVLSENLQTKLRYYGVSPWEIEVLYGLLNSHFVVVQDETEPEEGDVVSLLEMWIPLSFNEEFFQWFGYKRWERVKDVFKEMKRRRGHANAIRVRIGFVGIPKIVFTVDVEDKQWFNNAIEKIDFVLELLPHHLDPEKIPPGTTEISYRFDSKSIRWRLDRAMVASTSQQQQPSQSARRYTFRGDSWVMEDDSEDGSQHKQTNYC